MDELIEVDLPVSVLVYFSNQIYPQFFIQSLFISNHLGQLFSCLDGAEAAEAVVPNSVPVAIDFALSGEIERLELQVGARRSTAVIQVTLYLTNRRTRELLWSQRFDYAEPLAKSTPEATAGAFGEAMTKLCYDTAALMRETAAALR